MNDWKHCTMEPPAPCENYCVIEYRHDGLWQHHIVHFSIEERWESELDMDRCWYVAPPLTMPDKNDIILAKQDAAEA